MGNGLTASRKEYMKLNLSKWGLFKMCTARAGSVITTACKQSTINAKQIQWARHHKQSWENSRVSLLELDNILVIMLCGVQLLKSSQWLSVQSYDWSAKPFLHKQALSLKYLHLGQIYSSSSRLVLAVAQWAQEFVQIRCTAGCCNLKE